MVGGDFAFVALAQDDNSVESWNFPTAKRMAGSLAAGDDLLREKPEPMRGGALVPTLTYSPPVRRTAREIVFAHRNHNEGHDDSFSLSSGPDGARPRRGARTAPGVARGATDLGSSAYAAGRYACTVR